MSHHATGKFINPRRPRFQDDSARASLSTLGNIHLHMQVYLPKPP